MSNNNFKEEAAAKLKLLQERGLGLPASLNNHLEDMKAGRLEDRDDMEDDMDDDNEREDSDPEDHPEDQDLIKSEMKRENFGDFKSPFGLINSSSTTNTTMSSIMSPFFNSLAAQANSNSTSKLFSPSELFNSLDSSKAAVSSSSGSSLARPSPPTSPLKPTAFNLSSLGHGNLEIIITT